ncbi:MULTISPECIES: FimV/HubP family polar landmark protein [unclassified Pseudomonas]|uniref:FimV/HubP family polar landmark protein n=1 Tax=unclassified Pseudomonas TaxID=196821 RepID=UPI000BD9586B|nr:MULTISPECIES: FimV/HubP family polar landmark protein [unclassified Pseudomonas]PVZ20793.1 FimV-like protein [Pseudomonas sp. URIL14HWK12:I12]PVZ27859.1 FimV-like protein [Pseudomonas sp. URIL14HWK12:I10]PVZ38748.1 FimV-like protein [Pseudomonas sp. URIL14HWK12:I11]SNZ02179.1 FimV C-terminal domain-containing protein [Pseudomonas sp. URIL14HWK12:I9]
MHMRFTPTPRLALRLLKASCLAAAVALPGMANALGLGNISLHSGLNQPFNADIELLDVAGLGPEDMRVGLASPQAFANAGLDRPFFLSDLSFTPVFRNGRAFIHVASTKAVVEPYLSFVVQVDRPSGQLLRGYTLLIDPPGAVALAPAQIPSPGSRQAADVTPVPPVQAKPAAPAAERARPSATEGKRYVVQKGDTLWTITQRLVTAGTPTPPNELARDLRALNPSRGPLKAGQALLLPDVAVLPQAPSPAEAASTGDKTAPAPPAPAPDMAASVLNQQLQQNLDNLQNQVKSLQSDLASRDQHIDELQNQLSGSKPPASQPPAAPAQPAPTASPAAPVSAPGSVPSSAPSKPAPAAPVVVSEPVMAEDDSWMYQVAALVAVALLLGLLLWRRRTAKAPKGVVVAEHPTAPQPYRGPAVAATAALEEDDDLQETPVAPGPAPARKSPPATDALDGASIYIAYGRFNEALGILREGVKREPGRMDLRLRILEVLAMQGDTAAYVDEDRQLRGHGVPAHELDQVRERYPKIALALAATAAAAATASTAQAEPPQPEPARHVMPEPPAAAAELPLDLELSDLPDLSDLEPPVDPAIAEPAEFQLSLDDLSLDADWASVDPFDTPAPRSAGVEEVAPEPFEEPAPVDLGFTSNLKELPEVFEMPEEDFLGDFTAHQDERLALAPVQEFDAQALEVDFERHFGDEPLASNEFELLGEIPDLPDLDELPSMDELRELGELSLDMDDIDSQYDGAEKLEQAQALIDGGDADAASRLLYELLREGDGASRQQARTLLAQLENR